MKSFELKPTHEYLLDTLCNDFLGRNFDLFYLIQILNNIDDACSISLDGGWGSGKTFFVNHVKMILDANNSLIPKTNQSETDRILKVWEKIKGHRQIALVDHVTVYYDAWANDNDEDPVLSLIYSILKSGVSDCSLKTDVDVDIKQLISCILEFFSGRDISRLANAFKTDNPIDAICKYKSVQESIKEFFNSLLPEKGERLVIFIDELDRCRPSYAVRLLERIKHYFANERITFVFSININELQHTIKQNYGADFDASKYLTRFFNLRMSLPPINMVKYYLHLPYKFPEYHFDVVCDAVIKTLNFEIREVAQYLQTTNESARNVVLRQANLYTFTSYELGMKYAIDFFVPILVGLKIHNQSLYELFISGKDESCVAGIFSKTSKRIFRELLDDADIEDDEKLHIKLIGLYKNLFNDRVLEYDEGFRYEKLWFQRNIRVELIRISSMFSNYANFD